MAPQQTDPYNPDPYGDPYGPGSPPGGSAVLNPPPAPPPAATPPPAANPWSTAPTDGNWQNWWTSNVGTNTPSHDYWASLEPLASPSGVKFNRNASNAYNGKITLPGGQIVDVVKAFGTGDPNQMGWQWDTGGGGAGAVPAFAPPAPVNLGGPAGIPYIPPTPTFTPPQFKPPSVDDALKSPGYQFRTQQGEDALQRWAAAKGTLNDSGTAKALIDYGQGAASQEYQNVWNRDFNEYGANYKGWADSVLNPATLAYSTQAQAGQHQSDMDYQHFWDKWKYGADLYAN